MDQILENYFYEIIAQITGDFMRQKVKKNFFCVLILCIEFQIVILFS